MKVHELVCFFGPTLNIPLSFTAVNGAATIKLTKQNSPNDINLSISTDGGESWTAYTVGNNIDLASGQTILISGANDHFSKDETNYYQFQMTGSVEAGGNIQALMNYSDGCTDACYTKLFANCTSLQTSP